jgi:hypothetical protein
MALLHLYSQSLSTGSIKRTEAYYPYSENFILSDDVTKFIQPAISIRVHMYTLLLVTTYYYIDHLDVLTA